MVHERHSDFIVVGSGIAGLCFALEAAASGKVTILTKKEDFESNTNYAQGGIACVASAEDSFEDHVRDTLIAGAGICHEEVVRTLVREGPDLVRQLIDWGVRFTTTPKSSADSPLGSLELYDLGREGGHSHRRILHSKDLTGREVERALLKCLREHSNVTFLEHHLALDLITEGKSPNKRCSGVHALDAPALEVKVFRAPIVVLATGGIGRIYQHTTNPPIATGDGIAMAWRAGLPVANLEFVQFHPTAFYNATGGETFLISEAVRGEGAILRRLGGESFMELYDERGCLAPRDIVARAIDTEMKRHGESHVLLDCSNMSEEFFSERFPAIRELCVRHGVHPPLEPIPVVPAAHYSCGGVVTDSVGRTALAGLYVVGETAFTGVHGANRLASNSLLEALVFSHRAAQSAMKAEPSPPTPIPEIPEWFQRFDPTMELEGVRVEHCTHEVRTLMWDYVGIVRSTERLKLAAERLEILLKEAEGYFERGWVTEGVALLRNIVQTSWIVVQSALRRRESRGLHTTLDYPETRPEEAHDTV
ncbi:MAG: L-aspartate oxidase, partial [Candidatus Omnitrophica bacterium]|nr:L-aspartate oxidase [Candidatus Omnitrophota bacterium]